MSANGASETHVLPIRTRSVDMSLESNDGDASSPTVEEGPDMMHRFEAHFKDDETEIDDFPGGPSDGKTKRMSSPGLNDPQQVRTHELLERILETLSLSSAAGRVDRSTRARFWDMYKAEAEEFHADFLHKYNSELDITLIFAGLFCGVDATFLALMQPDLGPNPTLTTQVLLMMVVQSLNNGTTFPAQSLVLPEFNGPSSLTIWVQCLLYASLAASLFAALGAMLGKQWIGHYAHISEKGTAEHRCIDRQRKFVGLQTWHFHAVLECLPSLLQMSLFLFIIGLAGYLWNQQRTIAAVLTAAGTITIMFYAFMIISSVLHEDCPFRTPVSDALLNILGRATECTATMKKSVQRRWNTLSVFDARGSVRHSIGMGLLPLTAQHPLSMAHGRAYEVQQTATLMDMLTTQPRNQLDRSRDTGLARRPTVLEDSIIPPGMYLDLSASCVSWLLVTSTHPDVITTAARMVLEVSWSSSKIDPLPMMLQLRDAFSLCFVRRLGQFKLASHCHDRALACGQALLHVYFQRWCVQGNSETDSDSGSAEEIGEGLLQSQGFPALWSNDVSYASHPDLLFVIRTLQVLAEPSPLFLPQEKRRERSDPPKSEALHEWFSHEMVQCLESSGTPVRVKLYALDIFSVLFTRGLHSMFRKTYAKCFLACAYGMGYTPQPGHLASADISDRPEEALAPMLLQLTRTVSLQLQANTGVDPLCTTFSWELMGPLAHLCESGSFREVLRAKNVHHLAILLCRKVLEDQATTKQSITDRQWSWIDSWIRLGILTASPSRQHEGQLYPSTVRLFKEDGFKRIWQCHYTAPDREFLVPSDFNWIAHTMREARMSGPISTYIQGTSRVYFPRTVVYCLTMLCEVPEVTNGSRCKDLRTDVVWALRAGGVFGQVGLKLARALCGPDRDVNLESLRCLVKGLRSSLDFSHILSLAVGLYYQSSDEFYGLPESYPLHMAYLDILSGLLVLLDNIALPAALSSHIHNCLSIASILRLNNHDWDESEMPMMRACLGRLTDDRSWKTSSGPGTISIDSNDRYPNSFIRDVWQRLIQVVDKYLQVQPLTVGMDSEDGILTGLTLACACWQIHDTHPLPHDVLSTMTNLLQDVLSLKHIDVAEFERQMEIQRTFRRVSQVVQHWDECHFSEDTRDNWERARNILRDHIDIAVETLEPPLTTAALMYDSDGNDSSSAS